MRRPRIPSWPLIEQLMAEGPEGMGEVFTALFNLAMRLERERFLGAGLYEATPSARLRQRLQEQDARHHGRDGGRRRPQGRRN